MDKNHGIPQSKPDFAPAVSRLFPYLSYGQKVALIASIPLLLAATAIALLVADQSRRVSEQELRVIERELIDAKEAELANYMSLARTSIGIVYGGALPDDEEAKLIVSQILSAMTYGDDGFFFVYDYDGNNIVSPKQTYLIGKNWIDLNDPNGEPVVKALIEKARQGGGYHRYTWPRPSTAEDAQMVSYVIGLQDWRWAIGTGIFIDNVILQMEAIRAETRERIRNTFLSIGAITMAALFLVFGSGLMLNLRERRLADVKLKQLTQRVFDTQEEERGRVARELHDGISQILVGVRYALDLSRRKLATDKSGVADEIEKGSEGLNVAINEVRRISRDLRPGVLDDLGLGPALKSLVDEFSARTGIEAEFSTVVFSNRLDSDAKIALFRIAQESLTNIERHANATRVRLELFGHRKGATLKVEDNGDGIEKPAASQIGLGLRNMQERIEHLDGNLRIVSSSSGTVIEANLPLKHLLAARDASGSQRRSA